MYLRYLDFPKPEVKFALLCTQETCFYSIPSDLAILPDTPILHSPPPGDLEYTSKVHPPDTALVLSLLLC